MTSLAAAVVVTSLVALPTTEPPAYWINENSGLMWTGKDSGHSVTWDQAKAFCADLRTAGFEDWRLPDIEELEGLYDSSSNKDYKISAPLKLTACCPWSSTTEKFQGADWVMFFSFQHGARGTHRRGVSAPNAYRALCVRLPGHNGEQSKELHANPLERLVLNDAAATLNFPRPRDSRSWMKDGRPGDMTTRSTRLAVQKRDASTVFFSVILDVAENNLGFSPRTAHLTSSLRWDPSTQRYLFGLSLGHPEGAVGGVASDVEISDLPLTYTEESGFAGSGLLKMYGKTLDANVSIASDEATRRHVWRIATVDDAVNLQFTFQGE